jgi:hypothetical protein
MPPSTRARGSGLCVVVIVIGLIAIVGNLMEPSRPASSFA